MAAQQILVEMGFPSDKVDLAIQACGDNTEQAMEWLLAHSEDSTTKCFNSEVKTSKAGDETEEEKNSDAVKNSEQEENAEAEDDSNTDTAKSIQCDECQKLFRSPEEVEFHAVKSGHSAFSESIEEKKALTEEERRLKLKDLEDKMRHRRKEKEAEDRVEAIEREKKRIQTSRDIADTKRRMAEKEIKQLADERRREKIEDKLARERVKEQIERDKMARKEMFGNSSESSTSSVNDSPVVTAPSIAQQNLQKKEYDTARLQIRLPTGTPLVQEFKAKEPLSAVHLWVRLNRKDRGDVGGSFSLSTTFPRKTFTEDDMDKPLNILGLTPSAVLVVNDDQ